MGYFPKYLKLGTRVDRNFAQNLAEYLAHNWHTMHASFPSSLATWVVSTSWLSLIAMLGDICILILKKMWLFSFPWVYFRKQDYSIAVIIWKTMRLFQSVFLHFYHSGLQSSDSCFWYYFLKCNHPSDCEVGTTGGLVYIFPVDIMIENFFICLLAIFFMSSLEQCQFSYFAYS